MDSGAIVAHHVIDMQTFLGKEWAGRLGINQYKSSNIHCPPRELRVPSPPPAHADTSLNCIV
eukprot:scaffold28035_cov211-Skeletonema_marinoi.AAC.10